MVIYIIQLFKPEIQYCFLINKQFLAEGKAELTALFSSQEVGKESLISEGGREFRKQCFPSAPSLLRAL